MHSKYKNEMSLNKVPEQLFPVPYAAWCRHT